MQICHPRMLRRRDLWPSLAEHEPELFPAHCGEGFPSLIFSLPPRFANNDCPSLTRPTPSGERRESRMEHQTSDSTSDSNKASMRQSISSLSKKGRNTFVAIQTLRETPLKFCSLASIPFGTSNCKKRVPSGILSARRLTTGARQLFAKLSMESSSIFLFSRISTCL